MRTNVVTSGNKGVQVVHVPKERDCTLVVLQNVRIFVKSVAKGEDTLFY